MSAVDIAVLIAVAAAIAAAVFFSVRGRIKRGGGCGCGCSDCSGCPAAKKNTKTKK
ncbi:MAG: FeoB-associated Cys-rich membrane protein [Candidatus Avispirillum sp.]